MPLSGLTLPPLVRLCFLFQWLIITVEPIPFTLYNVLMPTTTARQWFSHLLWTSAVKCQPSIPLLACSAAKKNCLYTRLCCPFIFKLLEFVQLNTQLRPQSQKLLTKDKEQTMLFPPLSFVQILAIPSNWPCGPPLLKHCRHDWEFCHSSAGELLYLERWEKIGQACKSHTKGKNQLEGQRSGCEVGHRQRNCAHPCC